MDKEVKARYKSLGICIDCGHQDAEVGKLRCSACLEKMRIKARARYQKKKAKEIKPCPFCGNEAIELRCYAKPSYTEYIAVCDICWCEGPAYGKTPEEAWEKWNKRNRKNG